jgi:hypothetical protein
VKYAPEFCSAIAATSPSRRNFWRFIAELELLTGNPDAARLALDYMMRDGNFSSDDENLQNLKPLGPLRRIYHRWHQRHRYKHRPDWEKLFCRILRNSNGLVYESQPGAI